MIKFGFSIRPELEPSGGRDWKVVVVSNRSADYKPLVLARTEKRTRVNFTGYVQGFTNYLGLKRDNIDSAILFFYSYVEDSKRQMQIGKCKKYNIVKLCALVEKEKEKRIKLGEVVLVMDKIHHTGVMHQSQPRTDLWFLFSSPRKARNPQLWKKRKMGERGLMRKYNVEMNNTLLSVADIKKGEVWHLIYYTLDKFGDAPIVSSVLIDKGVERGKTNEAFWLNMYENVKHLYKGYRVEWDMRDSWVNLLMAINTFAHNYVLENSDNYTESWLCRHFDCDESMMGYILHQLFINPLGQGYVDNELRLMCGYAKQYKSCTGFWYVTMPSASGDKHRKNRRSPEDAYVGHWAAMFFHTMYFFLRCAKLNRGGMHRSYRSVVNKLRMDGLKPVLFGESTAFLYPSNRKRKNVPNTLDGERKMRFLQGSNFFVRLNTIIMPDFLDSHGIPGFYCLYRSRGGKLKYGVPFDAFLDDSKLERVVFYPFPVMSKELIKIAKIRAEQRKPVPIFKCYPDKGGRGGYVHHKNYVAIEDVSGKVEDIYRWMRDNFVLVPEREEFRFFFSYSLDQLMDGGVRGAILKKFKGKKISFVRAEYCYNSYGFAIKVY
jgi:hypothetical protein